MPLSDVENDLDELYKELFQYDLPPIAESSNLETSLMPASTYSMISSSLSSKSKTRKSKIPKSTPEASSPIHQHNCQEEQRKLLDIITILAKHTIAMQESLQKIIGYQPENRIEEPEISKMRTRIKHLNNQLVRNQEITIQLLEENKQLKLKLSRQERAIQSPHPSNVLSILENEPQDPNDFPQVKRQCR